MRPEIGKYYRLRPSDHRDIIGLCTGKSKVCDSTYIFEYWVKLFGTWEKGRGSYNYTVYGYSRINLATELEIQKYHLERVLEGRLPRKVKKLLLSL